MYLPKKYESRMKELLIEEYEDYLESFNSEYSNGLRVNALKISPEKFKKITPFDIEAIPWTKNGFYVNRDCHPAKHPYYYAGLYYLQEPSAMTPAQLLPINKGDKVLDLCAAPGGKSTELGAKLEGTGVLVSNDISASRAKALLKNIELFGITNSIITSEAPEKLAKYFTGYFDKILVDAPCSGEGMFRKEPSMIKNWEELGVAYYQTLQKEIVIQAVKMLKPGGFLLYSTCTFSPEENEGTIEFFLNECPEMIIEELPMFEGFQKGRPEWVGGREALKKCRRLWPHKLRGEGHFIALLRKDTQGTINRQTPEKSKSKPIKEVERFIEDHLNLTLDRERISVIQEKVYYMPEDLPSLKGLRLLRTGWYLGDLKKERFEPSQAFAMGLNQSHIKEGIHFSIKDEEVIRYLKGETLHLERHQSSTNGWKIICVDGFPLGWAKQNREMLKNKYYSGWRWM